MKKPVWLGGSMSEIITYFATLAKKTLNKNIFKRFGNHTATIISEKLVAIWLPRCLNIFLFNVFWLV